MSAATSARQVGAPFGPPVGPAKTRLGDWLTSEGVALKLPAPSLVKLIPENTADAPTPIVWANSVAACVAGVPSPRFVRAVAAPATSERFDATLRTPVSPAPLPPGAG